jgi:hypothetical protein
MGADQSSAAEAAAPPPPDSPEAPRPPSSPPAPPAHRLEVVWRAPTDGAVRCAALSGDASTLGVADGSSFRVFDAASGTKLWERISSGRMRCLALSHDGAFASYGLGDGIMLVKAVGPATLPGNLRMSRVEWIRPCEANALAFRPPDPKGPADKFPDPWGRVVAGTTGGAVDVYHPFPPGEYLHATPTGPAGHAGPVVAVAFSDDGAACASPRPRSRRGF